MNVSSVKTKEYENISNWTLGENKPKTNPIKANLLNAQMNVNKVLTKDYENISNWTLGENETKTNPIKANFKKAKMNVTSYITKGYENKPPNWAPKKRTQFSLTTKNNANLFAKRDYEKNRDFGFRQNKPKQTQLVAA